MKDKSRMDLVSGWYKTTAIPSEELSPRNRTLSSRRAEIGPEEIREAKEVAEARTHTNAKPYIIADTVERGLSLRVQGSTISWILKFGGRTKSLGSVAEIRTAKIGREVAARARAIMRDGGNVDAYLSSRRAGADHEGATNKVEAEAARAAGRWTWRDLAYHYADDYLSNPRQKRRGRVEPSLGSAAEARRSLTMGECEPLFNKLLSELRPGDLEKVRDACFKAGRNSASRSFVSNAKAALSFARKMHSHRAGLEGASHWWKELQPLDATLPPPRERFPSIRELARALYLAETTKTMPDRKIKSETSETVMAGLWFIVLTAQRTSAGLSLRKEHVFPWKDGPRGWQIAFFPGAVMKGRRDHALPIPPRLGLVLARAARDADPNSAFVFPSTRKTAQTDGRLSRSSIMGVIDRLRGRSSNPKAGAEFTGTDLLQGIPHFSPHDLRRTFATVCGDLSVRGDAISAVLAHADVATGQAPIRSADITRIAYDYSQKLDLKRQAIEAWTDALFVACDEEWAKHRPRQGLSRRVPRHDPWYVEMEREADALRPKIDLSKLKNTGENVHDQEFE